MPSDLELMPPIPPDNDLQDYFIDMIAQLAERARALGEVQVALHLDATAEARRHALGQQLT